ncbi:MAG: hypothetical protein LBU32_17320 [Clostridiales bacterium]|jgi:hypothetical protein|nr:hypothetical protein [Clostridiales bacterium]
MFNADKYDDIIDKAIQMTVTLQTVGITMYNAALKTARCPFGDISAKIAAGSLLIGMQFQ